MHTAGVGTICFTLKVLNCSCVAIVYLLQYILAFLQNANMSERNGMHGRIFLYM